MEAKAVQLTFQSQTIITNLRSFSFFPVRFPHCHFATCPDNYSKTQFPAHGFFTARGLAGGSWLALRPHRRKGQPIPGRLHPACPRSRPGRSIYSEYVLHFNSASACHLILTITRADRSAVNLAVIAVPASLALAYVAPAPQTCQCSTISNKRRRFGVVYMFCAVGVYV